MPADRPPQELPRVPAPPPGEGGAANEARASDPKNAAQAPVADQADRWEGARRWARRLGIVAVLLAAAGMLAVAIVIRRYEVDLPSTQDLKSYHPPQVTRVLAKDGTVMGELFLQRRTLVGIASVPDHVKMAVLAAEDAAFYQHKGLDYLGMLRAIAVNLRSSKARQGGSTITQQVVKNVLLTPDRTFDRKMREVILARRIEQELTKDEILELYLNHIYWGHGRYGVEEACRYYFGKSVRETTLAEAALLAGIVKGPSVYSPRVRMDKALARREYVLGQMLAKGFATKEEVEAARAAPVNLAPEVEAMSELAPEVVDEVRRTLRALVGPEADQGGYTVTTTIDPTLQAAARKAMRGSLDGYLARHKLQAPLAKAKKEPATFEGAPKASFKVYPGIVTGHDDAKGQLLVRVGTLNGAVDLRGPSRYNPKALSPSQFAPVGKVLRVSLVDPKEAAAQASASDPPSATAESVPEEPAAEPAPQRAPAVLPAMRLELGPEGAMVAIDVTTRDIVALVGSYEAVRHGLDRATFAKRQPGSTFKAFVYGYAIHAKKLTPATLMETSPAALKGYKPDNYDESEGQSPARVREALAHSVNVAAVNAIDRVGPANVAAFAQELGIESKLGADLSLALGAYEVTPREMAGAYAAFAGGGEYKKPRLIAKIVGPGGVELALPDEPPPRRVLDEAETYVVNSLLKSVVEVGTAKRALALGRPVAGKTGTSNASKDAWFVGYTTDYAVAVWTGFDDASPLGVGETGAVASLPAFVDFMREAHKSKPVRDFPAPATGIVRVKIDPESGLKAYEGQENAIEELFLAGTEPTEEAVPDAGVGDDAGEPDAGASTEEMPGLKLDLPHEGEPAAPPF